MRLQQEQSGPEGASKKAAAATGAFHALTSNDAALVEVVAGFSSSAKDAKHMEKVAEAISRCSYASKSPAKIIGTLVWLLLRQHSAAVSSKFPMYLKTCYDKGIVTEEAVRAWHQGAYELLCAELPCGGATVSAAEVTALKKASDIFIQWLDKQNEEEEDEEEEEADAYGFSVMVGSFSLVSLCVAGSFVTFKYFKTV